MTHRILLVLLSCAALGWAGPAMADDEGSGDYYGYDSAAEGAAEADAAMANAQYQTVMPDGSIIYGSRNDAAAADNGSADVAGDAGYYDYGGTAATTSSGFDGVTNWTDESGATPTGNTITNWTEGDVDPLAAGGGGIGLTGTGLGFDAMSGFSMQNMTKFFNPAKPGGCTLTGPMMGKIMGNFPMVEKFLGAQDKCNQQQVTKTMTAEQKSFGQYLARQQNQQLIFSKNSQMAERAAPGILAGMGGGGGASGGGNLFGGMGFGSFSGMMNNALADSGLGDAMNTFNGAMGTVNNAMNMVNTGTNFLNGALAGTGVPTGTFSNIHETNWTDADGGAVYSTAGVGSVATDNWSYDMGGASAAPTASSGSEFSFSADGTPLTGAPDPNYSLSANE